MSLCPSLQSLAVLCQEPLCVHTLLECGRVARVRQERVVTRISGGWESEHSGCGDRVFPNLC